MEPRTKSSEPPETDLDYYARPENYTGSSLNTLTRFLIAKDKEEPKEKRASKKKKKRSDERMLLRRYRHILPPELYGSSSSSSEDEEENRGQSIRDDNNTNIGNSRHDGEQRNDVRGFEKLTRKSNHIGDGLDIVEEERSVTSDTEVAEINSESGYGSRMRSDTDQFQEFKQGSFSDDGNIEQEATVTNGNDDDQCQRSAEKGDDEHTALKTIPGETTSSTTTLDSTSQNSINSLVKSGTGSRGSISLAKLMTFKNKLTNLSKDAKHRVYLQKFRKLTVGIVNILKLAKAIIKATDSPSALLKTFTAMSKEEEKDDYEENMKNYGLQFDPSYYRANKEISVSSEVKNILRLPPNQRSSEQIQTAMFGLQSLPSFAEYPLHMQEKLTKVAWYEIVTPMRTIIRQGHFAENFYFILSGQALVTIHKPGETSAQTAAIMRKGTSFGELALLHHSRRTATVTSHDTVQLLSVGRDDFFDIFMSGHGTDEMPEHIKFISQLEFMKDWPLERLLERPDQCLLHFFKRNMVILKDSKASEWFYVVKSGSCQVLKQLKKVTGRLGKLKNKASIPLDRMGKLQTGLGMHDSKIDNGRRPWRKKPVFTMFEKKECDEDEADQQRNIRLKDSSDETSDKETDTEQDFAGGKAFSKLRYCRKPSTGTAHFGRQPVTGHSTMFNRRKSSRRALRQPDGQLQQQEENLGQQPVFVQIEILKPKDVFGLDLVNFNNNIDLESSSVSLVSLGAECIMLSKAFFMKYANDSVKKRFSEIVQPYPDENTLQESLQDKVNWELYKRSLLTNLTAPKPTGLRGNPLTIHR